MKFKMRGLFTFRERNFRLSFLNWRERYKNGTLLRFYLHQPKEDTRSVFGKRLDILGGLFLAWLAGFLLLANLTGRPMVALALSMPLLAAEILVLKKLWELRERRRRLQRRLWLAGQKFMEGILKMDPQKDFKPYVRDILAALPGFQEMKLNKEKKNGNAGIKQGIDLEGVYRGVPVAVCCRRQEGEQRIVPDDIRAFAETLHLAGYKNGLFITTGDFGPGVLPVVKRAARRGIKLKLVNRYRLMELARQAGSDAFRSEGADPGTSSRTAGEKRAAALTAFRDSVFGSRKKAKSYFFYGLLLYGGYSLLRGTTGLSLVYLFFAALNFLLGAGSLYYGKTLEEMDPLEGLGPEK